MPRLNVRCCCQPQKIFGTMEVPEHAARGGSFMVVLRERYFELPSVWDKVIEHPPEVVRLEVRSISLGCDRSPTSRNILKSIDEEFAVYSDDRPIEFWHNVPGFVENKEETEWGRLNTYISNATQSSVPPFPFAARSGVYPSTQIPSAEQKEPLTAAEIFALRVAELSSNPMLLHLSEAEPDAISSLVKRGYLRPSRFPTTSNPTEEEIFVVTEQGCRALIDFPNSRRGGKSRGR